MDVGLDRFVADVVLRRRFATRRFGLLAHPASVDRSLVHVSDRLAALGLPPSVVFGPEHGYGGEAQDMVGVADATDVRGVPVRSLYGDAFDDLVPKADDLAPLDAVLVDLQDVGARYYTFVWTTLLLLRAAHARGVHVTILDRPNPLGDALEGHAPSDRRFLSFVGLEPVPVRHGLTLGELVALFARREGLEAGLSVVTTRGLAPSAHAPAWDRPFVAPSPNMPSYDTALVYPGACLVEGTNLSEGRGTTRPFELVGAPWLDGPALARGLDALGLPGFVARPVTFLPMFQKHAGAVCGGVHVHVTDPATFRPYATYLALVGLARRLGGDAFRFRTERYEFRDDVPAFDLLTGSSAAREALEAGEEPGAVAALAARSEGARALQDEAREALRAVAL